MGSRAICGLLVAGLLVQSGCTGMVERIVARRVTREMNQTFDLNRAQKKQTRASINRLIDEAPALLGPSVDKFILTLDSALAAGFNEKNLVGLERQLDGIVDTAALRIIKEAAPMLASLSDRQIAHADRAFAKRFRKEREPLAQAPKKQLKARADKFIDGVEEWTGRLSGEQEQTLRAHVRALPDHTAARIGASERRVRRIGSVVRSHREQEAIAAALLTEWKNRDNWGRDAPSGTVRRARARRTLVFIDEQMTRKQRHSARAHLRKIRRRVNRFTGRSRR